MEMDIGAMCQTALAQAKAIAKESRVRKAWKAGARISAINPVDFDFNFELSHKAIVAPQAMIESLAAVFAAAGGDAASLPA